jgi:hypothetical protein
MELRNNHVELTETDRELFGVHDSAVPAALIGDVWRAASARLEHRRAELMGMDMSPTVGVGWAAMVGAVRPHAFFELRQNLRHGELLEQLRHAAMAIEVETLDPNGDPLRQL